MRPTRCRLAVRSIAAACAAILIGAGGAAAATSGGDPPTAASSKAPIYQFLLKSGIAKNARPESALLSGVITVREGGRAIVKSTVRPINRRHFPEWLDSIQGGIINGTVVEPPGASVKVGTLDLTYSDGKTFTVIIYRDYYEITTSAGTICFTSELLTTVLKELLK